MRKEINLSYGNVIYGTIGKEVLSEDFQNGIVEHKTIQMFPKNPKEWVSYTNDMIRTQLRKKWILVYSLNQVHGDNIQQIDPSLSSMNFNALQEGDALFSYQKDQVLVVRTADCVPVFVHSIKRPFVAVIHSGWKGTKLGITENLLDQLLSVGFGLDELRLELGPYIQQNNYEVGEDVATFFKYLGESVCKPKGQGKYLLDVGLAIEKRVKRKFGDAINITNDQTEVYQTPQFFSHRAKEEGRNLNFILWES